MEGGKRWAHAALSGLLTVALLCAAAPVEAEVPATDCTYPLGSAAENGPLPVLSTGSDVEWAIIDGSFRHATKTALSVVSLWGTLHSVLDGRYRLADGGNQHNIIYKPWGENGWASPVEYPSNLNTSDSNPLGDALEPRAIGYKDKLWVAWEAQNQPFFTNPGVPIALRSRDASGNWSGLIEVSDPNWTSINRGINLMVYQDKLLIAWLSAEGASTALDFSIKGRLYDGETFGPIFDISPPGDGWGEFKFSLATDGVRIAAGFITQDLSQAVPNFLPMFTYFDGSVWSGAHALGAAPLSTSYYVNPAFYRGQLYLAFDTNDTALTRTGDFDVFLGVADLNTLELSPITQMSSKENVGEDINPQMAIFNDTLYFAWESSDDVLTLGNDLDLVVTTYNGTSWSTPYDFVRDEIVPTIDYAPHFVVWGDALHMYWIVDVRPPDGLAKDQRIATRLIARGPRWWDGLTATYEFAAPPRHGEPTTARVTVRDATGEPVVSPHFTFLFPNGSWAAINGSGSVISVDYVHNSTPVDPFIVRACGKALPLSAAGQDRVPGGPSVSGFDALPTAIALAGLAAALAARSAARRPR